MKGYINDVHIMTGCSGVHIMTGYNGVHRMKGYISGVYDDGL